VKIEHEETVTIPRYLQNTDFEGAPLNRPGRQSGESLKVISALGLRSLKPVEVDGVRVVPRDVVAACAPQPEDLGDEMIGKMCVGIHCKGIKDGKTERSLCINPLTTRSP
jgi:saccharopine dehydrogenase-like NADP-dependent oxidoreductase